MSAPDVKFTRYGDFVEARFTWAAQDFDLEAEAENEVEAIEKLNRKLAGYGIKIHTSTSRGYLRVQIDYPVEGPKQAAQDQNKIRSALKRAGDIEDEYNQSTNRDEMASVAFGVRDVTRKERLRGTPETARLFELLEAMLTTYDRKKLLEAENAYYELRDQLKAQVEDYALTTRRGIEKNPSGSWEDDVREDLAEIGWGLSGDGRLVSAASKALSVKITKKGPRFYAHAPSGQKLWSGSKVSAFVKKFYNL